MIFRIILISLFIVQVLYSQEKLFYGHEIFLWSSEEYESYIDFLTYKMEAISPVYDANFLITHNFQYCEETIPVPYMNAEVNQYGFSHVLTPEGNLTFGYGLYRVTIGYDADSSLFEFYLDYRDCDFSSYYHGKNDIWILFDAYWQTCKISWDHKVSWKDVEDSHIYYIWTEKDKDIRDGIQNTSLFNNFWKNSLAITDYENYNPRLIWVKHPTFEATNYKIC